MVVVGCLVSVEVWFSFLFSFYFFLGEGGVNKFCNVLNHVLTRFKQIFFFNAILCFVHISCYFVVVYVVVVIIVMRQWRFSKINGRRYDQDNRITEFFFHFFLLSNILKFRNFVSYFLGWYVRFVIALNAVDKFCANKLVSYVCASHVIHKCYSLLNKNKILVLWYKFFLYVDKERVKRGNLPSTYVNTLRLWKIQLKSLFWID